MPFSSMGWCILFVVSDGLSRCYEFIIPWSSGVDRFDAEVVCFIPILLSLELKFLPTTSILEHWWV
jgi:hypothetical protein